jgi:Uri superfamily endonuclease
MESNLQEAPFESGTYAVFFHCRLNAPVRIGRLGILHLHPGWYVYVGSAHGPGGLRSRLNHHCNVVEKPHWHLDYLHHHLEVKEIWCETGNRKRECAWAQYFFGLHGAEVPLKGFGASDCKCNTHLLWFSKKPDFKSWRNTAGKRLTCLVLESKNTVITATGLDA